MSGRAGQALLPCRCPVPEQALSRALAAGGRANSKPADLHHKPPARTPHTVHTPPSHMHKCVCTHQARSHMCNTHPHHTPHVRTHVTATRLLGEQGHGRRAGGGTATPRTPGGRISLSSPDSPGSAPSPLRDVEHAPRGGLVQHAAVRGPQAAQDPEERALAAAVGACDKQVHALFHLWGR